MLYFAHSFISGHPTIYNAITCYYYAKHRSKEKMYCCTNIKMENNKLKKF